MNRKEYLKGWCRENPEKVAAKRKKYNSSEKGKAATRAQNLKYRFGISVATYNKMLEAQEGCCAICGTHQSELLKPLNVEHHHAAGFLRGLCCTGCNVAIGYYERGALLSTYRYYDEVEGYVNAEGVDYPFDLDGTT